MTYYIIEKTYMIDASQQETLCDERNFTVVDEDGTALQQAEENLRAQLQTELEIEEQANGIADMSFDARCIQQWYTDEGHTQLVLERQATRSQVLQEMYAEQRPSNPTCTVDISDATLIGEAIVSGQSDVYIARERLYRTPDGVFILETGIQTNNETLHWEFYARVLSSEDAQAWAARYGLR